MNTRRLDIQNPASPSNRHAARLLSEHRHRERLVQDPELAALALLVVRISEDPAVQECAVHVCDHGPKTRRG